MSHSQTAGAPARGQAFLQHDQERSEYDKYHEEGIDRYQHEGEGAGSFSSPP